MWMHSKDYGFFSFLGDCFMLMLTCGFWFVWIIVREARRGNNHPKPIYGNPPPHQRQEIIEYRVWE